MALLQLAPRALSQLSVDSGADDSLVPLFRAIAGFELLTQLNLNMAGFGGTHVSREALLLLANLHGLRILTIGAYATHEKRWATFDVDDAGLAQILAGMPHLAAFDLLLPSYQDQLSLRAVLKSAGEHCRDLCRFHVCGRLCLVSLTPLKQEPPHFPALEDLQCFGFDYDAEVAAYSSVTGNAKECQDNGQIENAAVTAKRILCHAPKLQRLRLTEPTEQDNKVLELWDKWGAESISSYKHSSTV
jgi:hypothetical protein